MNPTQTGPQTTEPPKKSNQIEEFTPDQSVNTRIGLSLVTVIKRCLAFREGAAFHVFGLVCPPLSTSVGDMGFSDQTSQLL